MGHFSASCFISGIDIANGEVGIIPLIQSRFPDYGKFGIIPPQPVSNSGAYIFYHPISLPIWGEYDGYGRLENIKEDFNTKALELYFKKPIQEIVNEILDSKFYIETETEELVKKDGSEFSNKEKVRPDNSKWINVKKKRPVTACWVNPNVYNSLSDYTSDISHNPSSVTSSADIDKTNLKKLGFEYIETNMYRERYNKLYKHSDIPELNVYSDDTWIRVEGHENTSSLYDLSDFKKFIKEKFNYELDLSPIEKSTQQELKYDHYRSKVMDDLKSYKEILDDRTDLTENDVFEKLIWKISSLLMHYYGPNLCDRMSYFEPLKEIYLTLFLEGNQEFKKELCKWQSVYWNINSANRYIMPSNSGVQDGEWYAKSKLAAATLKELYNQYINYEDEYTDKENKDKTLNDFKNIINEIIN